MKYLWSKKLATTNEEKELDQTLHHFLIINNFGYRAVKIVLPLLESIKILKSLRGQTVHFVHFMRITQQAKIRFVAESTSLLLFFDLLCCYGFHKQILKTLFRKKPLQK